MKKLLLVFCLIIFSEKLLAQQFALYNTGTLYDSFENPSQRSFIPDTSRKYAFNFFVPNFNASLSIIGNGQAALKSRAFLGKYNDSALMINKGKFNHIDANSNIYFFMLKIFVGLDGAEEIGFSGQTRMQGSGTFSDESIALFNGTGKFNDGLLYNNIFQNNAYFQAYNQFAFSYREKISKQFAFGIKLSALQGINYQQMITTSSSGIIDKTSQTAQLHLQGTFYDSYIPGQFNISDFLPTTRNPGAAISIGTSYRTEDGILLQTNLKDLGFIHWSKLSRVYQFNNSGTVGGLGTQTREDSVYNKANSLVHKNVTEESFTKPIDGTLEFSVNKNFWFDYDKTLKYSPTVIVSKELFYPGFTAAWVNPVQYKNYTVTLTPSYNNLKILTLGGQFMKQTGNCEFYFGSDKLLSSLGLAYQSIDNSSSMVGKNYAYSGADFYVGFSVKFGEMIEHPMNSSTMATGDKGFFGRLWGRLFKTDQ